MAMKPSPASSSLISPMIHASPIHLVSPSLIIFVHHVMIRWCPLACSRVRKGGMSHRSRLMEDVSNARVTVSTPPDVEMYNRELNATGGAGVSPEIYATKVWIAAITTHILCDLHPCPCDHVSLRQPHTNMSDNYLIEEANRRIFFGWSSTE
ncbi:unnamed protein product [Brassica rapa subsp. trilocularis]